MHDPPPRSVVNFGRNVRFTPRHYYTPTTEAEVLAILDRHARGKVRIVGARHSWSDAIVSDDVLIDLRHFITVEITRDPDGTVWATVGGGCRIKDLLRQLPADVTLPSLGLITEQAIAGAISTATHGSGKHSLSHYVEEVRVAAYDATGRPYVYTWGRSDPELRAARCALGCLGVILSVRLRLVPQYDVAECVVPAATLDDVLKSEPDHPLQQFYLLPHKWTYIVQRRAVTPQLRPRHWTARLFRLWWYLGTDIGLHLIIKLLASVLKSPRLVRLFFRHVLTHLVLKNITIVDRSENQLVMEHELFRHLEIELFVPAHRLREATVFVRGVVNVFDGKTPLDAETLALLQHVGMADELQQHHGTFTQHYPITFRRVLPDDTLLSMTADAREPWYAISFITYAQPREPFRTMASFLARSMTRLFDARPHWGKYFPLDGETVERLYPALPQFREVCQRVDPNGVFRNAFAERVLFGSAAV